VLGPLSPFSEMAALLEMVRSSAHKLAHSLTCIRHFGPAIRSWHDQTLEARPSRTYDLALETFEKYDYTFDGSLGGTNAQLASVALHASLGVEDSGTSIFKEGESYDFESWTTCVVEKNLLPASSVEQLRHAQTGLRCCCGAWMEQKACSECYTGAPPGVSGVRCDFSGSSVTASSVWHCPRNKSPIHPFGQDVDMAETAKAKKFQLQLRLEQRMRLKLESGDDDDEESLAWVREKRHLLLQELVIPARIAYRNATEDLKRAKQNDESMEQDHPELKNRISRMRDILVASKVDWAARYQECLVDTEAMLARLDEKVAMLSHDMVRFKDEEDRKIQMEALEKEFDGGALHQSFNMALEKLKEDAEMAKEFSGLETLDVNLEENKAAINEVTQKMLQVMVMTMPPMFQAQVQQAQVEAEWTDAGLRVNCKLTVAGQEVGLEQTIPFDNRDVTHSRIGRSMGEKYHAIKERLASLAKCSTDAEMASCVECFECRGDEGMCVVCQEDLCAGSKGSRLKACGHVFHEDCIQGWLLGCKRECPICNAPLSSTEASSSKVTESEEEAQPINPGSHVELMGLRARPELNGQIGVIEEYFQARGRYQVVLNRGEATEVKVAVKPENFRVIRGIAVQDEAVDEETLNYDSELAAAIALSLEGCWTPGCHQTEGMRTLESLQSDVLSGIRGIVADAAMESPRTAQTAQLNAIEDLAMGAYDMFSRMLQ